ncbi:MAG: hypothetical protein K6C94_03975 [Candidatus Gastranaerophilales bacterium]|nr:hypothetical protein [Candidatus Gastranaerophilales bacterium]
MNFDKIFKLLLLFLLIFSGIITVKTGLYLYNQVQNEKSVDYCSKHLEKFVIASNKEKSDVSLKNTNSVVCDKDSCFCKMYDLLLPYLLVYKVKNNGKPLKLIRISWDSYVSPVIALQKADAILSYGIAWDIHYEDKISRFFKKNTYAFDCGISTIDNLLTEPNPYLFFKSECIGTDKFIVTERGQKSSQKIHTFSQKLKELNLENKKIYLKMDIAGAEIEVLPEILKYADNLTGMSVVIRLESTDRLIKFRDILKQFDKDFILIARNGIRDESVDNCKCAYVKNEFSNAISLTYINKKFADEKHLPLKQTNSEPKEYLQINDIFHAFPEYSIDWEVAAAEKLTKAKDKN